MYNSMTDLIDVQYRVLLRVKNLTALLSNSCVLNVTSETLKYLTKC